MLLQATKAGMGRPGYEARFNVWFYLTVDIVLQAAKDHS